jgi:hypothetical protein
MELSKIAESMNCSILNKSQNYYEIDISGAVVTNMMSNVLASDHDNFLLVTKLVSAQVIRTADIVSAGAVLITDSTDIPPEIVALAREFDITLLNTVLSATESRKIIDKLV